MLANSLGKCGDAGLQFRVRDKVRLGLVLGLSHFTCYDIAAQRRPQARI